MLVRIQEDLLNDLDAFIDDEDDKPSRPEAMRRILRDWLVSHGYLKG